MKKTWIIILLTIALLLLVTVHALAAPVPCQARYRVLFNDTVGGIAAKFSITPGDLWNANKAQMTKPNYPIYYGATLCIPAKGSGRTIPAWVDNQPAAFILATRAGSSLHLTGYNLARNSNWHVKLDNGMKIGKIHPLTKGKYEKTFNIGKASAKVVCFKNQMTDFLYCTSIYGK